MNWFIKVLVFMGILKPAEDPKQKFKILFGEAAAKKVEHGVLVGQWSREGYNRNISISFHIEGFGRPPQLDIIVFEAIILQAKEQGIVFSHFYSYGGLMRARCDYDAEPQPAAVTAA